MSNSQTKISIDYGKSEPTISDEAKRDLENLFYALADILSKPVNIQINVLDSIDSFVNQDKQIAGGNTTYLGNNKFSVEFNRKYIETFDNTEEHYLYPIVLHEFAHIEDKITFLNSESKFLKKVENTPRTYKEICRNIAYDVWTEFFAYRFTFVNCKAYQYPTLLYLVNNYEDLLIAKEGFLALINDREPTNLEIEQYINSVNAFIYNLVMHIAGMIYGIKKYYKPVDKTRNKKSFKRVDSFIFNLTKRISSYIGSKTIKTQEGTFIKLGEYVLDEIYDKLNINISRHNSVYYLVIYK